MMRHCPICDRRWQPTPADDYLLPSCGHFGRDHGAVEIPCHACGLAHAWKCITGSDRVPREVTLGVGA